MGRAIDSLSLRYRRLGHLGWLGHCASQGMICAAFRLVSEALPGMLCARDSRPAQGSIRLSNYVGAHLFIGSLRHPLPFSKLSRNRHVFLGDGSRANTLNHLAMYFGAPIQDDSNAAYHVR